MRYVLALFFPWLTFFTMGKVIQGFLCLLLQLTLIGWLPATIWSFISISNFEKLKAAEARELEHKRHLETLKAISKNNQIKERNIE